MIHIIYYGIVVPPAWYLFGWRSAICAGFFAFLFERFLNWLDSW